MSLRPTPGRRPVLVVLGGLPGTGKSTVARALAPRHGALLQRIDLVEQRLRDLGVPDAIFGPAGYGIAQALATANLALGLSVIADAVNPVDAARTGWAEAARSAGAALLTVELVCSDEAEHRRRVEGRLADIAGLVLPDWAAVASRVYEPWLRADLHIDTASCGAGAAVTRIGAAMRRRRTTGTAR